MIARGVNPSMVGTELAALEPERRGYGPTMLYRFYDAEGELLYVGVTGRPDERFNGHRRKAAWWQQIAGLVTVWLPSMNDALDAERAAIRNERPVHNRRSVVV